MNEVVLRIRGIDSLLFRDARPFSADIGASSARTLSCPYPGTVAGFVRTFAGDRLGLDWSRRDSIDRVLKMTVHAPILQQNGMPLFAAPADAVVYRASGENTPSVMCLRPDTHLPEGAGCNLPSGLTPLRVSTDVKPEPGYIWWDAEAVTRWLLSADGSAFNAPAPCAGMEREERVHVAIADGQGTGEEGLLYTVQFLSFERYRWGRKPSAECWALLARVHTEETVPWQGVGLLGGEKRLAAVEPASEEEWFRCPADLKSALSSARRVRLMLATPGIFDGGWKPRWVKDGLEGSPPTAPGLTLRLVSAAVRRREAVSGWDLQASPPQPKATRLLAPAGSVYFFEVLNGDPSVLAESAWLQPVSDEPQDARDGYGLALWGIW